MTLFEIRWSGGAHEKIELAALLVRNAPKGRNVPFFLRLATDPKP